MSKTKSYKTLILGVVLVLISTLLLFGIIKFGSLLAFLWIFPLISDFFQETLNMNKWMAYGLTFFMTLGILFAIKMIFSFNKKKRLIGIIFSTCLYIGFVAFMFFMEGEIKFDPKTGNPKICFSEGISGYEETPCNWDYNAISGKPVIKDRTKIARIVQEHQIKQYTPNHIETIEFSDNLRFFSPEGTPLIWYHEHSNGTIELFNTGGKHPQLNIELKPINSQIAQKLLHPKSKEELEKIQLPQKTKESKDSKPLETLRTYLKGIRFH